MKKSMYIISTLLLAGSLFMQSCDKDVNGCTDSSAINYNSEANIDDGSCEYQGEVVFWTDADYAVGQISVSIEGEYKGKVSSFYESSTPDCGDDGCVTVKLDPGSYSYTAEADDGVTTWSGSVSVTSDGCTTWRLYVTKSGVSKVSEELHENVSSTQEVTYEWLQTL